MVDLPTSEERNLILNMADRVSGSDAEQLRADLKNAFVKFRTADNSRVEFEIADYTRPSYKGQHPYGVEGKMTDGDGAELSVLLHADENGRLLELEIIRWDSGNLIGPDWRSLELY